MTASFSRRDVLAATACALVAPGMAHARTRSASWSGGVALPHAVQEIYPAGLGERIHVAGGLIAIAGQVVGATDRHVSWAPGEAKWTDQAPLPRRRHHPNLVSAGGQIYALGGFDTRAVPLDWTMTGETVIYDPASDQWSTGVAAPEPHGETVCVAADQHIHVIGGRQPKGEGNRRWADHVDSDRHLVLDTDTGQWQRAAPAPVARNSAAGARIDRAIHVVGGRQVGGGNLADHDVYDLKEDRWRRAAPLPQGQGGLAASVAGGRLFAFGGEYFQDGGGVYPEAWVYDPGTDQWDAIAPMPNPRHGLGAVTLNGQIYVIGGAKGVGGRQTSTAVDIYHPDGR